uniref:Uncharacterized protein n=1 Tax=Strigamia maritima TaxID=126957 RepID=T1J9K6_STRMM
MGDDSKCGDDIKDEMSDNGWELRVKEAELQYELESRLNTLNMIRQSVIELKEDIKWHKLEQKWIDQVPQIGEEMLRLVLELDGILQPLLVRRSQLRARLAKLDQ